jgi:mycothiol synthase
VASGDVTLASVIMWRIETRRELDDNDLAVVHRLLADAADHDGFRPLSDQLWLDLIGGGGPGFAAVLAFDPTNRIGGYAQLSRASLSTTIELVISPVQRAHEAALAPLLLRAALDLAAADGGGQVHWWVQRSDGSADLIAAEVGLRPGRRLLQMRHPLPIGETSTVDTRAFVVGHDEAEWLRVNNAAFHDHPEQGGWTIDALRQRQAEPWFDPGGFRLHERGGTLAAFCWTKVHDETTPAMGEIYVIAVDPAFHGLGLGRALTIAGLEHLAGRGLTVAMLYVDAANVTAMSLYERLGFSIHHADHAYVGDIPQP